MVVKAWTPNGKELTLPFPGLKDICLFNTHPRTNLVCNAVILFMKGQSWHVLVHSLIEAEQEKLVYFNGGKHELVLLL